MNIPPGADTRGILTESMFLAICAAGGWTPTPRRRGGLTTWAPYEGTPVWIFNPFATEWPSGRSTWSLGLPGVAPGQWNPDGAYGVGIFASEADGARATALTIRQVPPVFSFKPIADWIDADCVIADASRAALVANMNSWGTGNFAKLISTGWQAPALDATGAPVITPNPGPAMLTLADVVAFLGGEAAVRDWDAKGNSLALGYGALQEQVQELANKFAGLPGGSNAQVYSDIARIVSQAGTAIDAAGRARG